MTPQSPAMAGGDKSGAPVERKSPADFQAEADKFNARAAEIAKHITDEHARHAAQLQEYLGQQIDHALTRKTLIAKAGEFGITPAYARALLRKG